MATTTTARTGPQQWAVGGALVAVLLAVAAWFLVLSPQRAEAADLDSQAEVQEQTNTELLAKVHLLEQQYSDLPRYRAELVAVQVALPPDAALPSLVRSVRASAAAAGVELDGLVPGTPVLAAASAADPTATSTAAGATTTATTTATGAASGLVSIPVTISTTGSFADTERFLQAAQHDTRLLLVTGVTLSAADGEDASTGQQLTAVVVGQVFALPGTTSTASASAPAGGTTAAGSGASTATDTATDTTTDSTTPATSTTTTTN